MARRQGEGKKKRGGGWDARRAARRAARKPARQPSRRWAEVVGRPLIGLAREGTVRHHQAAWCARTAPHAAAGARAKQEGRRRVEPPVEGLEAIEQPSRAVHLPNRQKGAPPHRPGLAR